MKLPVAVTPLAEAEIFTVVALVTGFACAVNVTCEAPADIVTELGKDAALPPLTAVKATVVLAFTGAKNLIVPVVVLPAATVDGLKLSDDGPSASTAKPPVFLPPFAVAETETPVLAESECTLTLKEALLAPAGTVVEAEAEVTAVAPAVTVKVTGMLAAAGAVIFTLPVTVPAYTAVGENRTDMG